MRLLPTSALAIAMAMASCGAAAQSNITIYGVADVGFVRETGGPNGSVRLMSSGVGSGSRLGFKGKEDLGNGSYAFFKLENGYHIDTGAAAQGGLLFGRQAYVGLGGDAWGAITLGRQYSPLYNTLDGVVDPFETALSGNTLNIIPIAVRVDNMVQYATPTYAGFSADLAYGAGEAAGDSARNRSLGGNIRYVNGGLNVTLAQHKRNNALASDSTRYTLLASKYSFGIYSISLGYGDSKGLAGAEAKDGVIGATAKVGNGTFLASYIHHDDKSVVNKDARQWALGYLYAMSKRTDLYFTHGRISNHNGAEYTVDNGKDSGSGHTGSHIGLRHRF